MNEAIVEGFFHPARAHLVRHVKRRLGGSWPWSSYRCFLAKDQRQGVQRAGAFDGYKGLILWRTAS